MIERKPAPVIAHVLGDERIFGATLPFGTIATDGRQFWACWDSTENRFVFN